MEVALVEGEQGAGVAILMRTLYSDFGRWTLFVAVNGSCTSSRTRALTYEMS